MPTGKLSQPSSLGIFMEALPQKHNELLTQSPAPFPHWRVEGGAESLRILTSGHLSGDQHHFEANQKPTESCLIRLKDVPITQKITGLRSSVSGNEVKDQLLAQMMLLATLSLRDSKNKN